MIKRALSLTAATAMLGVAAPASAQLVNNNNGTVTINSAGSGGTAILNFNGNSEGNNIPGLTAQLSLTFLGLLNGDYSFSYSLLNNSTINSRVSGMAFNSNPDILGGSASGVFTNLISGGNNQVYPNGVGAVEVCFQSSGNSCAGGGNGGVDDGPIAGNGLFTLDFGVNTTPATITLSNFAVRYQELAVGSGSGTGRIVGSVPEPGTWAMMLIGFGGMGVALRRRRRGTTGIAQLA